MENNIELWNNECLEQMKNIPDKSIDCIICDLPYGATIMSWDSIINFEQLWKEYSRITKDNANIILFASGEFTYKLYNSNPKLYKYKLIWKKNVPTGMASAKTRPMKYYEEILVFQKGKKNTYNPQMKDRVGKGKACYNYDHYCGNSNHLQLDKVKKKYDPDKVNPSDVLEFNTVPNRKGRLHPTQKPLELLEWLVKTYSNEGDIVLDNCMGSGTTGVACKKLNRKFIGIELDPKFFEIAKNRIDETKTPIYNDEELQEE